jgi:hypothetical protein
MVLVSMRDNLRREGVNLAPLLLSSFPNVMRREVEVVAALNARLTSKGAARALQLLYPILVHLLQLHLLQMHLGLPIFLQLLQPVLYLVSLLQQLQLHLLHLHLLFQISLQLLHLQLLRLLQMHLVHLHLLLLIFLPNVPVVVTLNHLLAHLGVKVQGLVQHQPSQLVILVTVYMEIATMVLLLLRNLYLLPLHLAKLWKG